MNREMYYLIERDIIKNLGLSEEYFFSLPHDIQEALLTGGMGKPNKENKFDAFRKRMALKQYDLEENIKEKILTLLKKNK